MQKKFAFIPSSLIGTFSLLFDLFVMFFMVAVVMCKHIFIIYSTTTKLSIVFPDDNDVIINTDIYNIHYHDEERNNENEKPEKNTFEHAIMAPSSAINAKTTILQF